MPQISVQVFEWGQLTLAQWPVISDAVVTNDLSIVSIFNKMILERKVTIEAQEENLL